MLSKTNTENLSQAELAQRLEASERAAARKADTISAILRLRMREFNARINEIIDCDKSRKHKLRALRAFISTYTEPIYPHSPCQRGCAHCCHIPVALSQTEADLIAEEVGRTARTLPPGMHRYEGFGYDHPCPFLAHGECSIYTSRPIACRLHISLDDDDTLCRLRPELGVPVNAPYANTSTLQEAYVLISGLDALGDIRFFFPPTQARPEDKA